MTEQLSPEQRAYKALADNRSRFGYRHIPNRDRELASDIASAIRAAETAAVEAERDRCAETAFEGQKGVSCFVRVEECAAYNRGRRDAAEDIRRTPTTEASHG